MPVAAPADAYVINSQRCRIGEAQEEGSSQSTAVGANGALRIDARQRRGPRHNTLLISRSPSSCCLVPRPAFLILPLSTNNSAHNASRPTTNAATQSRHLPETFRHCTHSIDPASASSDPSLESEVRVASSTKVGRVYSHCRTTTGPSAQSLLQQLSSSSSSAHSRTEEKARSLSLADHLFLVTLAQYEKSSTDLWTETRDPRLSLTVRCAVAARRSKHSLRGRFIRCDHA